MEDALPVDISMQQAVLLWGAGAFRDLPWRRTRDPWSILVSETMLQQTQVDRVVPKFLAFMDRFPDVNACANGTQAEVITLWSGLGYNRRAVNLHRAAQTVVAQFGSVMPTQLDDLLSLPGVGPYTARAVQVFAYEQDVGVLDTNVGRVLARWSGASLKPKEAQILADAWVPVGEAWSWTQALFDFGSAVCSKRAPLCEQCPVNAQCKWAGSGEDPAQGSAATTNRQSPFEGSFRQGRGRVVAALREGAVAPKDLAKVTGWDDLHRIEECMQSLQADDMVVEHNGLWALK